MHRLPILLLLLLLSACAVPGTRPTEAQLLDALPATMGPFRRIGPVQDMEALAGGAGQGAAMRMGFAEGGRLHVSVYLYTRGMAHPVEGEAAPGLEGELDLAMEALRVFVARGAYQVRAPLIRGTFPAEPGFGGLRCVMFRLAFPTMTTSHDSVCVTARGGRLLKIRVTDWPPPQVAEQRPQVAGQIALTLARELWGRLPGP